MNKIAVYKASLVEKKSMSFHITAFALNVRRIIDVYANIKVALMLGIDQMQKIWIVLRRPDVYVCVQCRTLNVHCTLGLQEISCYRSNNHRFEWKNREFWKTAIRSV